MKGVQTEGVNLNNLFGEEIQALYTIHGGAYEYTVLHYISGIDQFDQLLAPKKFYETPAILNVTSHETGLFIILICSGKVEVFAFSRDQIVAVKEIAGQDIYVYNDNRFAKRLKSGGGPLFNIVLGVIGDAIIPKGTRRVEGKVYELTLLENGQEAKVYLARPISEYEYDEQRSEVDTFVRTHFTSKAPSQKVKFDTSSGCFIATACYGTYYHPDVSIFRRFRDNLLLNSKGGVWFTRLYYKISPHISKNIAKHKAARWIIRHLALRPLRWIIVTIASNRI